MENTQEQIHELARVYSIASTDKYAQRMDIERLRQRLYDTTQTYQQETGRLCNLIVDNGETKAVFI